MRGSVERALVAVGNPALPALQKVAKGNDATKGEFAKRIINQIQNPRRGRGGRGGRGERGGRGGRGRGGFGGGGEPLAGITLNDELKKKADAAIKTNTEKRQKMMEKMREEGDFQGMREATNDLRDDLNKTMKGILNEEQYKKFQQNTQRRGRRGRRGSDG